MSELCSLFQAQGLASAAWRGCPFPMGGFPLETEVPVLLAVGVAEQCGAVPAPPWGGLAVGGAPRSTHSLLLPAPRTASPFSLQTWNGSWRSRRNSPRTRRPSPKPSRTWC